MKNNNKLGQKLLLLCLSLLLAFMLLEIGARVYVFHFTSEKKFLRYASLKQLQKKYQDAKPLYSPHRYLGYVPSPNYRKDDNQHNALGYRGDEIDLPKPPGRYRIVCLGGSTTYTADIDNYRQSYPYLLEQELKSRGHDNVDVVNAGVNSWSSWESLINFEFRILDLDPDMIIVYHGINDIHPRFVWPPEMYQGDNSGRRPPASTYVSMPNMLEYSTFFRMLMVRMGWIDSHVAIERTIDKTRNTYYGNEFHKQKKEKTYPDGIFEKVSAKQMLATNKPVYFQRNLENMAAIANHRNIQAILATFANSPLFTDKTRASSEEYINAFEETNHIIKTVAEKMGVHCFDFANAFPDDKNYYTDGRHVTVAGAKLKARLFADYIIDKKLLPNTE